MQIAVTVFNRPHRRGINSGRATDPMTAVTASSIQQRPSSPIHDLNSYEQSFLLSPDRDQDLDLVHQPIELDLPIRVTARIRWIYFILGAAVLLPWNGKRC